MNIISVPISQVKINPNNPRIIKDDKFHKLVESIKNFPEMLNIRPIVVNQDMIVLGGNMRLKACKEAGLKNIPILKAEELSEEQQREFIIKDNIGYGEWDWEIIANEWNTEELEEWGLNIVPPASDIDLDDFFKNSNESSEDQKNKITLEYTEEDYNKVIEAFSKHSGSKEDIIYRLLGL